MRSWIILIPTPSLRTERIWKRERERKLKHGQVFVCGLPLWTRKMEKRNRRRKRNWDTEEFRYPLPVRDIKNLKKKERKKGIENDRASWNLKGGGGGRKLIGTMKNFRISFHLTTWKNLTRRRGPKKEKKRGEIVIQKREAHSYKRTKRTIQHWKRCNS